MTRPLSAIVCALAAAAVAIAAVLVLHAPSTLILTRDADPEAYEFVRAHGGDFVSLDSSNTFGVWWQPEGFNPATDTVLVSLHGHGGWATQDFAAWYPHIAERGYAYFGLQWWRGTTEDTTTGYYDIDDAYVMIRDVLMQKGVTPGNGILQGFSMGSARVYGVAALDAASKRFFGVVIANSGAWHDDYPMYADMLAGSIGDMPFAGTTWILFCAQDDEEDPNSCKDYAHTEEVLEHFGATVSLHMVDIDGKHGSFLQQSENVDQALQRADELLAQ